MKLLDSRLHPGSVDISTQLRHVHYEPKKRRKGKKKEKKKRGKKAKSNPERERKEGRDESAPSTPRRRMWGRGPSRAGEGGWARRLGSRLLARCDVVLNRESSSIRKKSKRPLEQRELGSVRTRRREDLCGLSSDRGLGRPERAPA